MNGIIYYIQQKDIPNLEFLYLSRAGYMDRIYFKPEYKMLDLAGVKYMPTDFSIRYSTGQYFYLFIPNDIDTDILENVAKYAFRQFDVSTNEKISLGGHWYYDTLSDQGVRLYVSGSSPQLYIYDIPEQNAKEIVEELGKYTRMYELLNSHSSRIYYGHSSRKTKFSWKEEKTFQENFQEIQESYLKCFDFNESVILQILKGCKEILSFALEIPLTNINSVEEIIDTTNS